MVAPPPVLEAILFLTSFTALIQGLDERHTCQYVGNGRRGGFKIRWWRHRVGSSPTTGTKSPIGQAYVCVVESSYSAAILVRDPASHGWCFADVEGFHAMRSERQWYEYNRTDEMIKVENAYWMLSVDEFIAICTEDEADETLIDMNSLL